MTQVQESALRVHSPTVGAAPLVDFSTGDLDTGPPHLVCACSCVHCSLPPAVALPVLQPVTDVDWGQWTGRPGVSPSLDSFPLYPQWSMRASCRST